jgi:HAMP domain-containing protein
LAAKGAKMRQTISRVPLPSRKPAARDTGATASSTALPAQPPPETTSSSTNEVVTLFSKYWPWPHVPEAVDVAKRTPEPTSNNYAEEEAAAANAQDDMPLVWPVHSAAELSTAETPSASAIKTGHVVVLLLGAFGLAGLIASAAFAFSLTRRQERHLPDTSALVARVRPQLSDGSTRHRQVGIARTPAPLARTPEPTREPREPRTPRQEFEASLQELLGARRAPAA